MALLDGFEDEPLEEDLESGFELDESDVEPLSLLLSVVVSDFDSDDSEFDLELLDFELERLSFL